MKMRKSGFTLVEILIVIVVLGILAAIVVPQFSDASTQAKDSSLVSNLQTVRSQIQLYKIQHSGALPGAGTASVTDALTKYTDVGEKSFRCPCVKDGRCHYAINPNFKGLFSSFDMVVLFETKEGWNQHGGPEIMSCDRHKSGCLVLFGDFHVEYVKPDHLDQLKWKDDQNQ